MPAQRTTEEIVAHINGQFEAFGTSLKTATEGVDGLAGRVMNLEQMLAALKNSSAGGLLNTAGRQSWGAQVAASDGYKNFVGAMGGRGSVKIPIKAALSTVSGSDGLAAPDRQPDIIALPRQKLSIRNLLAPGRTSSNLVQFNRMVSRVNAAAPVGEGQLKPESDLVFEVAESPVRTIATWIPLSKQAADDVPALESLIDTELRYMVAVAEEEQLLGGDGTGENILGLIPQATPYSPPFEVEDEQMFDTILLALAQAQQSKLPATGIVVNDLDFKRMQAIKDGTKKYIGAGPFGSSANLLWSLPILDTPSLAEGEFLVGAFAIGAQVVDRMDVEVVISSEDRDNLIRNMLTLRGEERLALAVKRPSAFVFGQYPTGV